MGKENKELDLLQTLQLGFESQVTNIVGGGLSLHLLGYAAVESTKYGADELVILKVATGVVLGIAIFANSLIEGKERLNSSKNEIPTSHRS